jgi:ADP-heptose:LPS heptosyltransferase
MKPSVISPSGGANRLRQHPCPRRVLAVRFGALGDLLFATPALRALYRHGANAWGEAPAIDVIVGRGLGDALAGLPYVRRVIEWDRARDGRGAGLVAFCGGCAAPPRLMTCS